MPCLLASRYLLTNESNDFNYLANEVSDNFFNYFNY